MRKLRGTALITLFALAVPSVSSGAAPRPDRQPRAPWSLASERRGLPAERLRQAIASQEATLEQVAELRREALTAPRSLGGSGMVGIGPGAKRPGAGVPPRAVAAATTGDGIQVYPLLASDLDGDGNDEVLTLEAPDYSETPIIGNYPATLSARHGADGTPIWTVPTDYYMLAQIADVTGDGLPEVIVYEDEWLGEGVGAFVALAYGEVDRQRVRVLSASDGAELWHADRYGTFFLAFAGFLAGAIVLGGTGLVDQVVPMADADADGTGEVFVGSFDFVLPIAFAVLVLGLAVTGRYAGETLGGEDGASLGTVQGAGGYALACVLLCAGDGGFPFATPIGDVSGDERADVLLLQEAPALGTLEAQPVTGDSSYWRQLVDPPSFPIVLQLDGVGSQDVLLLTYSTLSGLEGSTGAELWSRAFPWDLFVVGDVDGDAGTDLVLTDFSFELPQLGFTGVSGATGADLWTQTYAASPPPGYYAFLYTCYCTADLTGDGVDDMLLATEIVDPDFNLASLEVSGISGRDGAAVWTETGLTGYRDLPLPIGGDVNGNGTQDLATFSFAGSGAPVTIKLHEGSTYKKSWDAELLPRGDAYVYVLAGDLVGKDGDEIVVGLLDFWYDPDTGDFGFDGTTHALARKGEIWSA